MSYFATSSQSPVGAPQIIERCLRTSDSEVGIKVVVEIKLLPSGEYALERLEITIELTTAPLSSPSVCSMDESETGSEVE